MILFVYNADSGKVNAAFDVAHKLLSPSTYSCQLCQLTHGVLKEKEVWKNFRENVSEELLFLHRDEYESQYKAQLNYPIVLKKNGEALELLLSTEEINNIRKIEDLIERVKQML